VIATREGPELEERLAVYERHLARMEELIPRRGEVPTLLNTITAEANRYGVVMGSLRPEPLRDGDYYLVESYQLTVIGGFHDVGRFLTSIASLPRIITPVDVEVEPYTGQAPPRDVVAPVTVSFRIETYQAPGSGSPIPDELAEDVNR
jgi:Tfp pilus assembly protein PilO